MHQSPINGLAYPIGYMLSGGAELFPTLHNCHDPKNDGAFDPNSCGVRRRPFAGHVFKRPLFFPLSKSSSSRASL